MHQQAFIDLVTKQENITPNPRPSSGVYDTVFNLGILGSCVISSKTQI